MVAPLVTELFYASLTCCKSTLYQTLAFTVLHHLSQFKKIKYWFVNFIFYFNFLIFYILKTICNSFSFLAIIVYMLGHFNNLGGIE